MNVVHKLMLFNLYSLQLANVVIIKKKVETKNAPMPNIKSRMKNEIFYTFYALWYDWCVVHFFFIIFVAISLL